MKPSPRPTAAKQPPNLSELARQHGVSRESLRAWRDSGLDLTDDAAIAAKIAASRSPAASATKAIDGGESLASAKLRRERALADRAELEVLKRRGQLIELDFVAQAFSALGAAVSSALKKLPSEFADRLEGLSAADIQKATGDHLTNIYSDIHQEINRNFKRIQL